MSVSVCFLPITLVSLSFIFITGNWLTILVYLVLCNTTQLVLHEYSDMFVVACKSGECVGHYIDYASSSSSSS